MKSYLVYDIEIKKAILGKDEKPLPGIIYAEKGWQDDTLGISCVTCYSSLNEFYQVFMADNMPEFFRLVHDHDVMVGFNTESFDNKHIAIAGCPEIREKEQYDLLREMWRSAGLGETYVHETHGGFGLDATGYANFGIRKTGTGAKAPILYQLGKYGELMNYGLWDTQLEKKLFQRVLYYDNLNDPRSSSGVVKYLQMRQPLL